MSKIKLESAIQCMESLFGTLNDYDNESLRIVLDRIAKLQNTLNSIQEAIPCHNSESGFVIDHCNENGDYVATEWVDPTQIVFNIQKILSDASEEIK